MPTIGTNQYRVRVYADGNTTVALLDKTIVVQPRDRYTMVIYTGAAGLASLELKENL